MMDIDQLRSALQSKLEEIKTLRDELRLKAHLGGMDGKTRLERLEQEFSQLESQLRDKGQSLHDSLGDNLSEWSKEAKDLFSKLRAKLG